MENKERNLGIHSESDSSDSSDPLDMVGRGSERWDIGDGLRFGFMVFAGTFTILEGALLYQTFETNFMNFITELPKLTMASLELATVLGTIAGLSVAQRITNSRS